ncbi:hypothetical protein CANCADRAFT_15295, partial [Tortispora caseinolytica NRRL Y-17796]
TSDVSDVSGYESEDDFDPESETLIDRLYALRDVIPPTQRSAIASACANAKDTTLFLGTKAGSLMWSITSSLLLVGVPYSLAVLGD